MQDSTGGLEVEYKGKWYPITPVPGTLIVNLGRMLEYFTYGIAKGNLFDYVMKYKTIFKIFNKNIVKKYQKNVVKKFHCKKMYKKTLLKKFHC